MRYKQEQKELTRGKLLRLPDVVLEKATSSVLASTDWRMRPVSLPARSTDTSVPRLKLLKLL